jgi:hypothetical protein
MKTFHFAVAITLLALPIAYPIHAQDGGFGGDSIDIMLGDRGGGRGGFNNNTGRGGVVVPESKVLFSDIQSALKKGKTPLDKAQEKPLKSLLDLEVVTLTDRLQVIRLNNANENNNQGGFPGGQGFPQDGGFQRGGDFNRGGPPPEGFNRGGNPPGGATGTPNNATANNTTDAFANTIAIQSETVISLRNDEFLDTKLPMFLTPEQVAVIQKARKEDKENATCLGGLLDRVSGTQTNTGGRGNRGNFNFNNNSTKKTNGQPFCMAQDATPSARLEPIRKELAKANLPLSKDKESIAEVFMKSQIKDLEDALRTMLTANFSNNRGGNSSINRSTNIQIVTQSGIDDIYKKAGATLNPPQTESLKKWHFEQILARGGVESIISIEAVQGTPLTDYQIARVTAAWTDLRNQAQAAAKAANKNPQPKDLDNAVMPKVVAMLEPPQIASYEAAKKAVPAK